MLDAKIRILQNQSITGKIDYMAHGNNSRHNNFKLGLILGKRNSLYPYISLERLYKDTLSVLTQRFNPLIFNTDDYATLKEAEKALEGFIPKVDIIFELPDRLLYKEGNREIPTIFFGLGSMPKGHRHLFGLWRNLWDINSILFSSKADIEIFNKIFGNSNIKAYFVPWPVDCSRFKPQKQAKGNLIRQKIGIPLKKPLLLYAGRINIQKNIHTLLKMFREIVNRSKECRLCIVGDEDRADFPEFGVSNKGYGGYIRKLIEEYKIGDKVIMIEKLDDEDLIPLYSTADILINCTINHDENFGQSQTEAMACGTPVVCSKWGGLKDNVIGGKTGYYMETILTNNGIKVDWHSGVDNILYLLNNPKHLKEMSTNCARHVKANLCLEKFADKLENAIRDTLKSKKENSQLTKRNLFRDCSPSLMDFYLECLYLDIKMKNKSENSVKQIYSRRNYRYYKFFITPYASQIADNIYPSESTIPYFLTDTFFRKDGVCLDIRDPIWPRTYKLKDWEFKVLLRVDGINTIKEIYSDVRGKINNLKFKMIKDLFRRLSREGALSFEGYA